MFETHPALRAWVVCLCASLYFAYELVQLHMLNAISPFLLKDLHLTATDFGKLCSTYLVADVLFLLPVGMILDRFSTRRVILAALFLCIAGTIGFAFANSLLTACVCHFLSGIGNAFCFLSCMMLVSRWFPKEKQAFVISLVITIGLSGGVIAQTPFSLLAETVQWRQALLLDGLVGLLLFGAVYSFVYDRPAPVKSNVIRLPLPFFEGLKRALGYPQNILCGIYTGLMNLPLMIIGAMWGSLYLMQVHGLTLADASFTSSLICLGTIVGSPLAGRLADYWGEKRMLMIVGSLLSIGVMFLIMFMTAPTPAMMKALFFLLGFFSSSQVLGYPLVTESSPPELTGTSMGVAAVIIMGLAAIAQPLSGYLMDMNWNGMIVDQVPVYSAWDYQFCFWMFPLSFLISLFSVIGIQERKVVLLNQ